MLQVFYDWSSDCIVIDSIADCICIDCWARFFSANCKHICIACTTDSRGIDHLTDRFSATAQQIALTLIA